MLLSLSQSSLAIPAPPFRAAKEPLEKKERWKEAAPQGFGLRLERERVGREGVRQEIFLNLHIKKHSPLDSMLFSMSV